MNPKETSVIGREVNAEPECPVMEETDTNLHEREHSFQQRDRGEWRKDVVGSECWMRMDLAPAVITT